MLRFPAVAILILLCTCASACATKLEYQSPKQVNLSGDWVLNKELSQDIILPSPKRGASRLRPMDGGGDGRSRGGKTSRSDETGGLANEHKSRPSKPDSMTSIEITIEQSVDSMGVRYHNDNYRDVDWGKIKYRGVTTTAGWKQETLQIVTNSDQLNFSESYHLDSTGEALTVIFNVAGEEFSRVYNKKSHQEAKGLPVD